jgi:hypothetical protein
MLCTDPIGAERDTAIIYIICSKVKTVFSLITDHLHYYSIIPASVPFGVEANKENLCNLFLFFVLI